MQGVWLIRQNSCLGSIDELTTIHDPSLPANVLLHCEYKGELMNSDQIDLQTSAGGQPSFVQQFSISGLFGYRTISLDSEHAATVLIARNGAGKTTMLGALDAFLRCQFGRLSDLTFDAIECKLRGLADVLTLKKSDLEELVARVSEIPALIRFAKVYEFDVADVVFFILWEYPLAERQDLYRSPIFEKVLSRSPYTYESAERQVSSLMEMANAIRSPITVLRDTVAAALAGIEVVYLPTYRRIELSLPEAEEVRGHRRAPSIQSRLGLTRRGLHTGDIQFGLADISARLNSMHQEIMAESNQKYAEISANIIDDLISGDFDTHSNSQAERPSISELSVFFERLKDARNERYFYVGPFGRPNRLPDLGRIESGNIPAKSEKFLTYFLGKLNSVIQKTRDTERAVENFIASCNLYLSTDDPTTDRSGVAIGDEKELKLDRASLQVSVWRRNVSNGESPLGLPVEKKQKEIPLDALSSGEKQMISLFARLYLYPKRKLVLIDEPELSLSLDWQRKILPDILNADLCEQVVAITHSPFIFDNELDIFAKALKIQISDSDCVGKV